LTTAAVSALAPGAALDEVACESGERLRRRATWALERRLGPGKIEETAAGPFPANSADAADRAETSDPADGAGSAITSITRLTEPTVAASTAKSTNSQVFRKTHGNCRGEGRGLPLEYSGTQGGTALRTGAGFATGTEIPAATVPALSEVVPTKVADPGAAGAPRAAETAKCLIPAEGVGFRDERDHAVIEEPTPLGHAARAAGPSGAPSARAREPDACGFRIAVKCVCTLAALTDAPGTPLAAVAARDPVG
jgi:hypothetical protein